MTPPETPPSAETQQASLAAPSGSAARVEQCDNDFAAAWATRDNAGIRRALVALGEALREAIGTGPMPAESRDTEDVGPVPPNVKAEP